MPHLVLLWTLLAARRSKINGGEAANKQEDSQALLDSSGDTVQLLCRGQWPGPLRYTEPKNSTATLGRSSMVQSQLPPAPSSAHVPRQACSGQAQLPHSPSNFIGRRHVISCCIHFGYDDVWIFSKLLREQGIHTSGQQACTPDEDRFTCLQTTQPTNISWQKPSRREVKLRHCLQVAAPFTSGQAYLLSQFLVLGLQVLAVSTPRRVELHKHILALSIYNFIKVLSHNHLDRKCAGASEQGQELVSTWCHLYALASKLR